MAGILQVKNDEYPLAMECFWFCDKPRIRADKTYLKKF
jgi:hypothetical protein